MPCGVEYDAWGTPHLPTETAIQSIPWADLTLLGVGWAAEGRDLVLRVQLAGQRAHPERLVICRWAAGVRIDIHPRGGPPLTWGVTFEAQPDGTWSVRFDFANDGEVRLICNEVEVVEPPVDA